MRQLSTFYNPIATAYLEDNHSVSSEDTELTSNQSGREVATNISDETDGDLVGDLNQVPSVSSAAIDYLPNFAFYTRNQVLTPSSDEVKTLDFEEAFQHHLIDPPPLMMLIIMKILNSKPSGVKQSEKNFGT